MVSSIFIFNLFFVFSSNKIVNKKKFKNKKLKQIVIIISQANCMFSKAVLAFSFSGKEINSICGAEQYMRIINKLNFSEMLKLAGKAIAVGYLINCRPMKKSDKNDCYVKFNPGLYCHIYNDVKAIKPFDWKGSQGWKNVPEDIIDQIEYI